jgi:hypothetical protein
MIPRVFLGDRGFLQRYGSRLELDDVIQLMKIAAQGAPVGFAVSDRLTAEAAMSVNKIYNSPVLLHTQSLITMAETELDIRRIAATFREYLKGKMIHRLEHDQLFGGFIRDVCPSGIKEYCLADGRSLVLNESAIQYSSSLSEQVDPVIITFGGDWLDLCLILGRYDLIWDAASWLKRAAANAKLLAFSYLAPICLVKDAFVLTSCVDGLLLPINLLGDGMLPGREYSLAWAAGTGLLVCALHILALGRIPVLPALDYVLNHENVPIAIVGASTVSHITTLTQAIHLLGVKAYL